MSLLLSRLRRLAVPVAFGCVFTACMGLAAKMRSSNPGGTIAVATENVYLEIHALDDSTPAQQLSQAIRLTNGADQSLVAPAPFRIHGTVTLNGDAVEGARVYLTAHGGIPNRPLPPILLVTDANGRVEASIPQGSYSVVAYPPVDGTVIFPPKYFTDVSTDSAEPPTLDLALWDHGQLVTFTGTLELMDGVTLASSIQVSVFDGTGAAGSHHLLSTPTLTNTAGYFSFLLPPVADQPATLRLHLASGEPTGAPFPTLDPEQSFPAGSTHIGAVSLDVGKATLKGTVYDAAHMPVPNAQVTVIAQPSLQGASPPFTYQNIATTDDHGAYSVDVFTPGDGGLINYSVVAVPLTFGAAGSPGLCRPASPSGVMLTADTNVMAIGRGEQLTRDLNCTKLFPYYGSVATSDTGVAVAGTLVTASISPSADLPAGLSFQTTADSKGDFMLVLTAGLYQLSFTPPDASHQPFTLFAPRKIDEETAPTDRSRSTSTLLPPFELTGRLYLGDALHPLAAQLDAYLVDGTTTIKIASTVTRADGRYSLLLPGAATSE